MAPYNVHPTHTADTAMATTTAAPATGECSEKQQQQQQPCQPQPQEPPPAKRRTNKRRKRIRPVDVKRVERDRKRKEWDFRRLVERADAAEAAADARFAARRGDDEEDEEDTEEEREQESKIVIERPDANDVLLGVQGLSRHKGNNVYRLLIEKHQSTKRSSSAPMPGGGDDEDHNDAAEEERGGKEQQVAADTTEETTSILVDRIVAAIEKGQEPPGRFLRPVQSGTSSKKSDGDDKKTSTGGKRSEGWRVAPSSYVRKCTLQALRKEWKRSVVNSVPADVRTAASKADEIAVSIIEKREARKAEEEAAARAREEAGDVSDAAASHDLDGDGAAASASSAAASPVIVAAPGRTDVLLPKNTSKRAGRPRGTAQQEGNRILNILVDRRRAEYTAIRGASDRATRKRRDVAERIAMAIEAQDPPGRFLRQCSTEDSGDGDVGGEGNDVSAGGAAVVGGGWVVADHSEGLAKVQEMLSCSRAKKRRKLCAVEEKEQEERVGRSSDGLKAKAAAGVRGESARVAAAPAQQQPPVRSWNDMFYELALYKAEHGDCLVHRDYEHGNLGSWVWQQRRHYRQLGKDDAVSMTKLESDRKAALTSIGFAFDADADRWERMYKELLVYKAEHGHINIPSKGTHLGRWLHSMRSKYRELNTEPDFGGDKVVWRERLDKLEALGVAWRLKGRMAWDTRYEELRSFQLEHGHCMVPQKDPERGLATPLGEWVARMRYHHTLLLRGAKSHLTEERIQKLNDLGFDWKAR